MSGVIRHGTWNSLCAIALLSFSAAAAAASDKPEKPVCLLDRSGHESCEALSRSVSICDVPSHWFPVESTRNHGLARYRAIGNIFIDIEEMPFGRISGVTPESADILLRERAMARSSSDPDGLSIHVNTIDFTPDCVAAHIRYRTGGFSQDYSEMALIQEMSTVIVSIRGYDRLWPSRLGDFWEWEKRVLSHLVIGDDA